MSKVNESGAPHSTGSAITPQGHEGDSATLYRVNPDTVQALEDNESYYSAALNTARSIKERKACILAARHTFAVSIVARLLKAQLLPQLSSIEAYFEDDQIGSAIEELIDDRDFDGKFDVEFDKLAAATGLDRTDLVKALLVKSADEKTLTQSPYFADAPDPRVRTFAQQNGMPWDNNVTEQDVSMVTAQSRGKYYENLRFRADRDTYNKAKAYLTAAGFFRSVSDPHNLEAVCAYFSEKYPAECLVNLNNAFAFAKELEAVKKYLFCIALLEEAVQPLENLRDAQQVDYNEVDFQLNPATLSGLSENIFGQHRVDCGALADFDQMVFSAIGIDTAAFAIQFIGEKGGHGQVVGLQSGTWADSQWGPVINNPVLPYFVGNNFNVYVVVEGKIYGEDALYGREITNPRLVKSAVEVSVPLTIQGVSPRKIIVHPPSASISEASMMYALQRVGDNANFQSALFNAAGAHMAAHNFIGRASNPKATPQAILGEMQARSGGNYAQIKTYLAQQKDLVQKALAYTEEALQILSSTTAVIEFPANSGIFIGKPPKEIIWESKAPALAGLRAMLSDQTATLEKIGELELLLTLAIP